MNAKIGRKLCESIDQLITFVEEACKDDMIPRLQADEITNGLLDARIATTARPAPEPAVEEVASA